MCNGMSTDNSICLVFPICINPTLSIIAESTRIWYAPREKPDNHESYSQQTRPPKHTEQVYAVAVFVMVRKPTVCVKNNGFEITSRHVSASESVHYR